MSLQTIMPIKAERLCVMLTPYSVRDRLADFDLDNDGVTRACEEHWIAPAFDIGLEGRRALRLLPSGVEFFARTGGARTRRIGQAEMFDELLRGRAVANGFISGEAARSILNCEGGHMNALVDGEWLAVKPGTERRRGPGGSDLITLASFKEFLKARIL